MAISNSASGFRPGVCTSTTRPTSPFNGQVIYETDTKQTLVWQGTVWVMLTDADSPPGLQLIRKTTFSGSATFYDVDNIFTSEFSHYRVLINLSAVANFNTAWIQYIDSSGNNVGASYYGSVYGQDFTSASTSFQTATTNNVQYIGWVPNAVNSFKMFATIDLGNVTTATPTNIQGQFTGINAGSAFLGGQMFGIHTGTTIMRGLRIANSQGSTMNGDIAVYGYRN